VAAFEENFSELKDSLEPLNDMSPIRREMFSARLERWWPDLLDGLAGAYADANHIAGRAVRLAASHYAARSDELHSLDLRRSLEPDWFQRPTALGYAAYADRFADGLSGTADHIAYLQTLGMTYLHLMPILQPRPEPNDGGYAVADYRSVRSDLGSIDDLRSLATNLRRAGISLCLDLVLNHVAREHEWASKARAGDPKYRAYFYSYPDRSVPDQYEATLPEVFPASAPGSFTWDEELNGWVWTTFHDYQWDVAWSNPDVFLEYADIVLNLANLGVDVFRLDAIAFIWKRLGTDCQNQPEVHAIIQALRTLTRLACPATIFKAEAIVGPKDLAPYLGTGKHHGKVSDLAYHNSLMVQIWSMLATRDVRLASNSLSQLPTPPSTTAWVTYARCHDDIGWAIDDQDAATVGLNGFLHRSFLSDFYTGQFPGSWARGVTFEHNEATGDRRISGSLASLAGLESGDAYAVDRIMLVHAVILGFGGLPVIWMGDEVGLLNDSHWANEPAHQHDNRWIHRPRMPWSEEDPGQPVDPAGIGPRLRVLMETRRGLQQLHASVPSVVLPPDDPGVLLVLRKHPLGPMLGVYNVTEVARSVSGQVLRSVGLPGAPFDAIGQETLGLQADRLLLGPYRAMWLTS
jgi:amylosucrase